MERAYQPQSKKRPTKRKWVMAWTSFFTEECLSIGYWTRYKSCGSWNQLSLGFDSRIHCLQSLSIMLVQVSSFIHGLGQQKKPIACISICGIKWFLPWRWADELVRSFTKNKWNSCSWFPSHLKSLNSKITLIHNVWTTNGNHHAFLGIAAAYNT